MFDLQRRLVEDYAAYIQSFIRIRDERIQNHLGEELGSLWPDPMVQLSPKFETAGTVDELVESGKLHSICRTIFLDRRNEAAPRSMRLYRHQVDALERAQAGRNYVLTTGTGSGKSLSYMLPIIDSVLKSVSGNGTRAVIVYPMNALANSQRDELEGYLGRETQTRKVTFARYTGQEKGDEREQILSSPPDILLTNYVMLELMLTRPAESRLIESLASLQFIVLDELHTYRGRQGADVSLLVRRLRQRTGAMSAQCIGTSATMSSEGTAAEKRAKVAEVATRIFGARVTESDVIGETLVPATDLPQRSLPSFSESLRQACLHYKQPLDYQEFRVHPVSIWIEAELGLISNDEDQFVRQAPRPLKGSEGTAQRLATAAQLTADQAEDILALHIQAGASVSEGGGRPVMPFRLHQFLSPGTGIFATLEESNDRKLSLEWLKASPDDAEALFYPLAFCRSCGQDYYIVTLGEGEDGADTALPRDLSERVRDKGARPGFLYFRDSDMPALHHQMPDEWFEPGSDRTVVKQSRKKAVPEPIRVSQSGQIGTGLDLEFIPTNGSCTGFGFCPRCGVAYGAREGDFKKLSTLGFQGRSTATTTLGLKAIEELRTSKEVADEARKVLCFTDNRQDASLQAGHLNDFVETSLLRSALYRAANKAGEEGLRIEEMPNAVFRELDLPQEDYASEPSSLPTKERLFRKNLKDVLGFRVMQDQKRGWRVNAPNLEQVDLIEVEYPDLAFLANEQAIWEDTHPSLAKASPEKREKLMESLAKRLRTSLAIKAEYFDPEFFDQMKRSSFQNLKTPWALRDEEEQRVRSPRARLQKVEIGAEKEDVLLTPRSKFGMEIREALRSEQDELLPEEDRQKIAEDIVKVLKKAGILAEVGRDGAFQLKADSFVWKATVPKYDKGSYNRFFEELYAGGAAKLKGIRASEHTGQTSSEDREDREKQFKEGILPFLVCSPTMELGVDIKQLNVVNLRNVPPTPANYAQRSGRAGRSGQPALIYTYCTGGSPHDQYYFRRPEQMAGGVVAPPRLDLANEDLIRSHIYAVWLGESGVDLKSTMVDQLIRLDDDNLGLQENVRYALGDRRAIERTRIRSQEILDSIADELDGADWLKDDWLEGVIAGIPAALDQACSRWRDLYRAAQRKRDAARKTMDDPNESKKERDAAKTRHDQAVKELELLRGEAKEGRNSDFYVYRYLASEGFLPGYSFPRLPLNAFLPGSRGRRDDYLSRPRFLAISEFGPQAIIYHEGNKYVVDRVTLPSDALEADGSLRTEAKKICPSCSRVSENGKADEVCSCGAKLGVDALRLNMMQLSSVQLRRRERINSDEEERNRQGFEIITAIGGRGESTGSRQADILAAEGGNALAQIEYIPACDIWRINQGWSRRQDKADMGFDLDPKDGRWKKDKADENADDADVPAGRKTQRVLPYVRDRRNSLILTWSRTLPIDVHASLMAALKSAIQAVFQLEDQELAAEPVPSQDVRNAILFYEAAEGGAGVLRRMIDEPDALGRVAAMALDLCHFDPETGEDRRRARNGRMDCSAACYDCLMSYFNQRDHLMLDRMKIKDYLLELKAAAVHALKGSEAGFDELHIACTTELERRWLRMAQKNGLRLPTAAQQLVTTEDGSFRPDFVYDRPGVRAAVFVDGPVHDHDQQPERDERAGRALENAGWTVVRFHHSQEQEWPKEARALAWIFGAAK